MILLAPPLYSILTALIGAGANKDVSMLLMFVLPLFFFIAGVYRFDTGHQ